LAWCLLMPFNLTWSAPGPWAVAYAAALALVVAGAPAAAAVLAVRHGGDVRRAVLAGTGTGALAGLTALVGGCVTIWQFRQLLDSSLLDKGPQWRPPEIVERVIPSYLAVLVVAPLLGALIGWLVAGVPRRWAIVPVLAVGLLAYPTVNAMAGRDDTVFGGVGATTVVFSPAGGTIVTSNGDYTWILWNVTDPGRPRRLATFNDEVRYSPDGRLLASRNALWSLANPARPYRIASFRYGEPVAFSPDGRVLASEAALWGLADPAHPTRLGTLAGGGDEFFAPDGRTFYTRDDATMTVWDVTDPSRPAAVARLAGGPGSLSPDGHTLVAEHAGEVVLWDVTDATHPRRTGVLGPAADPADPGGVGSRAVFSPDSRLAATGARDGTVLLWSAASATRIAVLPSIDRGNVQIGASDTLTTMAFAPDGRTLSVVTGNATVTVWDVTDPVKPVPARTLTRRTYGAGRVAFSPDTGTLAGSAVDGSNSVTLWKLS
jgi:WD40 repeat protein